MKQIELRPISPEEFEHWRVASRKKYAAEKEKSGLTKEAAKAEAERSFSTLLPEGEKTPRHHIYTLVESASGEAVGTLWWNHKEDNTSWIYDIVLKEEFRGRGYGRATMQLAEADMRAKGVRRMGLHVFGHNLIAQNLYRSLGMEVTNLVMQKDL